MDLTNIPSGVITGDALVALFKAAKEQGFAIPAVNCSRYRHHPPSPTLAPAPRNAHRSPIQRARRAILQPSPPASARRCSAPLSRASAPPPPRMLKRPSAARGCAALPPAYPSPALRAPPRSHLAAAPRPATRSWRLRPRPSRRSSSRCRRAAASSSAARVLTTSVSTRWPPRSLARSLSRTTCARSPSFTASRSSSTRTTAPRSSSLGLTACLPPTRTSSRRLASRSFRAICLTSRRSRMRKTSSSASSTSNRWSR
mmetsp:Transcript_63100/g.173184  ORF Transcript_63100/g.173184 Transcript_63100/m.173184 type:complete len:257 (+) Transcript_63100:1-771(+)